MKKYECDCDTHTHEDFILIYQVKSIIKKKNNASKLVKVMGKKLLAWHKHSFCGKTKKVDFQVLTCDLWFEFQEVCILRMY